MHSKLNGWSIFFIVLAAIGALNWGLIGIFNWNLVDAILAGGSHETTSTAARFVYAIVGLGGLGALVTLALNNARIDRVGTPGIAARP